MIIVRLRSGLGNQMFQYAFFKQMQVWHGRENVKLDVSTFHWKEHGGLELDKIFGIDFSGDTVPKKICLQYADVGCGLHHRILRRIRGKQDRSYVFWKELGFDDYKKLSDVYIEGYWNAEYYFEDVKKLIREIYQFDFSLARTTGLLLERIERENSVGVHVRRGDYKKYPGKFPLCSPDYYRKASGALESSHADLKYFIFSDDIKWCRRELHFLQDATFVDNRSSLSSGEDMMMMSRCKFNIIANSTYSWWAAWLNPEPGRRVFYPSSILLDFEQMPKAWKLVN